MFRYLFQKIYFENRSSIFLQNSTSLLMDGSSGEEASITLTGTTCTWRRLVTFVSRDTVTWFPSAVKRKITSYGSRLIFRNLVLGQIFKIVVTETTYACTCVFTDCQNVWIIFYRTVSRYRWHILVSIIHINCKRGIGKNFISI